jgi:hypothetical protein
MSNEINNVNPLERYLALRTVRDNVFYQKPLTYNTLDISDDVPGPARGASIWYSDLLPSLGIVEKSPEKRREQIATAIAKAKESKQSAGDTANQAIRNAAVLGLTGIPASAAVSTLFRFLRPRLPVGSKGKLQAPIRPIRTFRNFKKDPYYRNQMVKNILDDSLKGGLFSAITGAATPIISGTAKPSDKALESAGKIIQDAPVASAIPGADLVASLTGDKPYSRAKNTALGAGIGMGMGAAGSFLPALLNLPKHVLTGLIKRKLPISNIAKDFSDGARKGLPLNSSILGTTGALGGFLLPKTHQDNEQTNKN